MNIKFKDVLIIILMVIIVIMSIYIVNKNKEKKEIVSEETNLSLIETEDKLTFITIEKEYDLATQKLEDYKENLLKSKLTNSEKEESEKLYENLKNAQSVEQRERCINEINEKYNGYRKKYITDSEKKKMATYQEKLDKVTEKYNEYIKILIEKKENGRITEKQEQQKNKLEEEILEDINKLPEIK